MLVSPLRTKRVWSSEAAQVRIYSALSDFPINLSFRNVMNFVLQNTCYDTPHPTVFIFLVLVLVLVLSEIDSDDEAKKKN